MNQECQIQVIIIKPRITVAFVRVYHVRYFFGKKGNYFWGLCFRRRVVIFGGSLISAFANTCDILSLVSEVGLLLSWIPAWSSAPFEGSLLSQLYGKWQTCRGLPKTHYDIPPNIRRLCRKALVPSPHLLLVSVRFRFCWAFEVSIRMVESKMMLFALLCLLSTVRLSHSDPGYSMNGTVYYTKG